MSLMEDFYAYVSGHDTVKDAVGLKHTAGRAKVYPQPVPEGATKPYIVVARSPEGNEHNQSGASKFTRTILRVDCHGTKAIKAQAVADAVTSVLDGARGVMGDTTVLGIFVRSESDDATDAGDGSETNDHVVPLEVEILHHREVTTPTLT